MKRTLAFLGTLSLATAAHADQQIPDDLIVQGSTCVGFDCVNGESFGFDTLMLKENNVRIRFNDTSTSASFPRNDWELVANDSANGGRNHFSIVDASAGRTVFSVLAGAPANAMVITDRGYGLGTDTPATTMHVAVGDTPTMRLEQTGQLGWTPYAWDVGANEWNFFVRDGNTRTLPVRVMSGAADNAFVLAPDGAAGFGTPTPDANLHVFSLNANNPGGGAAQLHLENASGGPTAMVIMTNSTDIHNVYDLSGDGVTWEEVYTSSSWSLGNGVNDAITVAGDGNVTIAGVLTEGSSRDVKHRMRAVEADAVLEQVANLPIKRWRYRQDAAQSEHLGPMAEDFHAAFGLGVDNKHIAALDVAGVALTSVQALQQRFDAQQDEVTELRRENQELKDRLARIEALLLNRP